jgi:hypothetical protein
MDADSFVYLEMVIIIFFKVALGGLCSLLSLPEGLVCLFGLFPSLVAGLQPQGCLAVWYVLEEGHRWRLHLAGWSVNWCDHFGKPIWYHQSKTRPAPKFHSPVDNHLHTPEIPA